MTNPKHTSSDPDTQEAIAWANKVIKAKGTSYTPASRNAAAFILASCDRIEALEAEVEPLCPFTDRPAWECAAACTCAHFKPTGIIKHTNPPAAPTDALVEKVAKALAKSDGEDPDLRLTRLPGDEYQWAWQLYADDARAAIAAMQEAKQ